MSAIMIDSSLVHYEVFGRGQPVIFLHSWLGSWRYWVPSMEMISDRFRAYAFDFWGFGDSDRSRGQYAVGDYVDQLLSFMRELGMVKTNLIGHGLGGVVAVQAAVKSPNQFLKIIVSGMPVYGESLSLVAKPGGLRGLFGGGKPGEAWVKLLKQMNIGDEAMLRELTEDTTKSGAVVQQIVDQLTTLDMREDLTSLKTPTLGVFGENDVVVGPDHATAFDTSATEHQMLQLKKLNHFPFLESTNTYNRMVLDFLTSPGATTVQIKEEWRRRLKQTEYL